MQREIERKFLVNDKVNSIIANCIHRLEISQGYFSKDPERIVRIRHIIESYDRLDHGKLEKPFSCGIITIKIKNKDDVAAGVDEFEYRISSSDALNLLNSCHQPIIKKTRYIHIIQDHKWEIDVFSGDKEGLILAEIELKDINEYFPLPEWISEEVTGKPEYSNSNM